MTFKEVLEKFRKESFTEKDKGTKFERLMRAWLLTDPRYNNLLTQVWLWEDFPGRKDFGGKDTGIDLVAKTDMGEYWAIQCKCYKENAAIDKPSVDSFLATSSRAFKDEFNGHTTQFAERLWISTTNHWGANAEEALKNQMPPVSRVSLADLHASPVDWEKLLSDNYGKNSLLPGKKPMKHQLDAISKAYIHYIVDKHDRGKLIMACGTGKTYTSLLTVEQLLGNHGLVLFMVPSIALLGQTLNAWAADAKKPIKAVCICSDNKASRKVNKETDDTNETVVDLALPATTHADSVKRQLLKYRDHEGLVVVFSTYQSIDAVSEAQKAVLEATDGQYGTFDFIVCDEAHRTTGVKMSDADESNFTKIHSDNWVKGKRRLYMTATPRLYGNSAKVKAAEKDCVLCSMDDVSLYGEEYFRVNFSYAVQNGLLTDYKVLVLTVSEDDIPDSMKTEASDKKTEVNMDDTSKLIGVVSGLSKLMKDDNGRTWETDPRLMRRAVAFCSTIEKSTRTPNSISSKYVASLLPKISEKYNVTQDKQKLERLVSVSAKHIDGSMNSQERNDILQWLAEESDDPRECKVVTNVRCLSEGVDVPSLDAVLFLAPRNSQVDVVQSVGRVMRTFHKGQEDEKKYGYIIIPIVVPPGVKAEDALNKNASFDVVWNILNALRSHDDRFQATIEKIALRLQQKESAKDAAQNGSPSFTIGRPGFGGDGQDAQDALNLEMAEVNKQLELRFGELSQGMYAKLVEKCGDRLYWENWAKEVGVIAQKFIERIGKLINEGVHKVEFEKYLAGLQRDLNPSVDQAQAIEMLAQHMITRPVFDALFSEYQFVNNNAVSRSMQAMIKLLEEQAFEKDTEVLERFYNSVRTTVGGIDNLADKQTIIKNLYEKFFKGAFPLTVEKLGIVYTPVECVDFIIHSVNDILKSEFNKTLSDENVHILDPFTGTGTFITRLLQSGLIDKKDMERKYRHEIHCNEIMLLAYYIADVNIESVYHEIMKPEHYLNYDGICLTDTFQLAEPNHNELFTEFFQDNSERVKKQMKTKVRVIIGNPPYSVGQNSANDNAKNLSYPELEKRIADTYVKNTKDKGKTIQSLYDSYIKAYRWASDRIPEDEGGVIAFISNGAWIDSNSGEGFRKTLEEEFTSIYVFNLRGNQRTAGELSRKEGGKIFGSGSRTPIAITLLVKKPKEKFKKANIHYYDIGDYLTREQKLKIVDSFHSIGSGKIDWKIIQPNEKQDWINQRDGIFDNLILLGNKKDSKQTVFSIFSAGDITHRDVWCYNSSSVALAQNMTLTINFYNAEKDRVSASSVDEIAALVDANPTKIKWDQKLFEHAFKGVEHSFDHNNVSESIYRPYFKQWLYFDKSFNWSQYQLPKLFPSDELLHNKIMSTKLAPNKLICVSVSNFSVLMTNCLADLHLNGDSQCFPLYWYEERKDAQLDMFDTNQDKYIRHDGITDWILKEVRSRYGNTRAITKEHIFYYVYGILHSQQYRERFADDLKKSLPRIPIVEKVEDFMAFYKAGKELAELHLNYEDCINQCWKEGGDECYSLASHKAYQNANVQVTGDHDIFKQGTATDNFEKDDFEYFSVDKMRFAKVRNEEGKLVPDKSKILFNEVITIEHIPAKAYEYIVNGKSAIEWIMERYAVTVDKNSLIKNDPNDWSKEHNQPRYILDLLLSVISLSCQTVDIVNALPQLNL